MAKQQAQPRVVLLTGKQIRAVNPNKYTGPFRAVWCAEHHFTGPWPCDCPAGPQTQAWNSDEDAPNACLDVVPRQPEKIE